MTQRSKVYELDPEGAADGHGIVVKSGAFTVGPLAGDGAGGDGTGYHGEASLVDYIPSGTVVPVDTTSANHIAFPAAITLRSGKHLTVYRTALTHAAENTSKMRCKTSTDDGQTWSAPVIALDTPYDDGGNIGVTQAHDDTVVAVAVVCPGPISAADGWYSVAVRSTDEGATWSAPITINAGYTARSIAANAVTLPNGDILCAMFGRDSGVNDTYAVVAASSDGGLTWARRGVVAHTTTDDFNEPCIQVMPDGELLCFIRNLTHAGVNQIILSRSIDGGATWTTPRVILNQASGLPIPHVTRNGLLVLAYRDMAGGLYACQWATSADRGNTWALRGDWSGQAPLGYDYAGWLDLADGDLGIVYSLEPADSSYADLYYMRFRRQLAEKLPLSQLDTTSSTTGQVPTKQADGTVAWATPATGGSGSTSGAGELLMQDGVTGPPVPLETEARDDWLYQG